MLKSLCIAFATYSRIPTPRVGWSADALRYAICFFPLIGAVIGALEYGWLLLSELLCCGDLLRGAVAAALPLLITGGIHADGFCDTVDALSSHAERERKLEILKDSHCGAFAVIFFGLWLALYVAGWAALDRPDAGRIPIIALTANAFSEDVANSLQSGLNAHLSKPVEPEHLYPTLEELIWEAEQSGKETP